MKRFLSILSAATLVFAMIGCDTEMQEGEQGTGQEGGFGQDTMGTQQDTMGGEMDTTMQDTAVEDTAM